MKKIMAVFLAVILCSSYALAAEIEMEMDYGDVDAGIFEYEGEIAVSAETLIIDAPSAILIEKETGEVIYEKNADEKLEPASVTKVMTILLIVEAVNSGVISLDDMVTTSAYAASMGGSQIYLEEGEQMSVSDMLKAIVVSSANDAAVAMAEHLSGSEQAFAARMNERAAELGAVNTYFSNCTGLLDDTAHTTTARDISLMSAELIKHDWIKEYTTIWMDSVRGGEFGLSSTNKLVYYYSGTTGLKTGFTSRAGHCLAATAERDGVEYIAVVMHCETSNARFESAKVMLSFAFANYTLVSTAPEAVLAPVAVELGSKSYIQPEIEGMGKILVEKIKAQSITKTVIMDDDICAPIAAGDCIGVLQIAAGEEILAEIPIVSMEDSPKITWGQMFFRFLTNMFTGC